MKATLTLVVLSTLAAASAMSLQAQEYYPMNSGNHYHPQAGQAVNQQPNQRPLLNLLAAGAGAYVAVQNELHLHNQQVAMQRMQQAQWEAQQRLAQQQAQIQAQQQMWMAQQQQKQQAAWQAQQQANQKYQQPSPLNKYTRQTPDYRAIGEGIHLATGVDVNNQHRVIKKEWDGFRDQVGLKTPKPFKKIANAFDW